VHLSGAVASENNITFLGPKGSYSDQAVSEYVSRAGLASSTSSDTITSNQRFAVECDTTGVRCSAAAFITAFPALTLPVRKMKSNGSCKSSLTISRSPETAAKASGSKYFGINSNSNSLVAGIAADSFNMHGLPAERAVAAGRSDKSLLYRPVTGATELASIGIARATKGEMTPAGEKFCECLRKTSVAGNAES
jgi:hypothetical protein